MRRIIKKSQNRKVSVKKNLIKIRKNRRSGREKLRLNFRNAAEDIFDIQGFIIIILIILLLTYVVKEIFFAPEEEIVFEENNLGRVYAFINENKNITESQFYDSYSSVVVSSVAKKAADAILGNNPVHFEEDMDISRNTFTVDNQKKNLHYSVSKSNDSHAKNDAAIVKDTPLIALIIDDVGISRDKTSELISINYPLTLSFLPYGKSTNNENISSAKENGHEVMLHVPMEPRGNYNAGKNTLKRGMKPEKIRKNFFEMLKNIEGIAGVNNHMGSSFTSDAVSMNVFLDLVKEKGLFFVDSKTLNSSLGGKIAAEKQIPYAVRDVFIDHIISEKFTMSQLAKLENIALDRGYAVGIGHPHRTTISALEKWLPLLDKKGIKIVPVSYVVDRKSADTLTKTGSKSKLSLKSEPKNVKNN